MDDELKNALIRSLPFLLMPIGIAIGIKRKKLTVAELQLQPPTSYLLQFKWCLGFLLFVLLAEVTLYKLGLLGLGGWKHTFLPSVFLILGMAVFAPVAEELFFRGVILAKLTQFKINRHLAIIIQAVLFVLLHTSYELLGTMQIFIDGMLFAYARYHTKSLYTPMIMHATGNIIAVVEKFL